MEKFIETIKLVRSILRPHVRPLSKWHIGDQKLQVHVKDLDYVSLQNEMTKIHDLLQKDSSNNVRRFHGEMTNLLSSASSNIYSENTEQLGAQCLALTTSIVLHVYLIKDGLNDEWLSQIRDVTSIRKHNTLLWGASDICEEYSKALVPTQDDTPTVDKKVLAFADYLINKLRILSDKEVAFAPKDLTDIHIDELSFLRCNLINHLLLQNPVKEIKPLTISTQALIFETGLFIYLSLDAKEDETSPTAAYCSSKLPDLLKVVDLLKQQASDLFNKFFPESWQSNYPKNNVLEYVDFLINKLEELLYSKEAPLNALKHQTKTVYEEIVSARMLLCDSGGLAKSSQMEILMTRYRSAAHKLNTLLIHLWPVKVQSRGIS
ncbi:hypothetical protein ACH5RR_034395 [Cinchona calisaya]|uniref:Uncharacterized protein n=1 Tax=Cinchona calisaya TaxID=153742 RepID=A0ABD2YAT3_9GENT